MIDRISREVSKDRLLIVNAGNVFDARSPVLDIESATILKILAACGVEVMGVGPGEIAVMNRLGEKAWRKLVDHSPINLVSANIEGFLPYVRLQKGGKKVLITSILDPFKLKQLNLRSPQPVGDPATALHRVLSRIAHDYAIVIIHSTRGRVEAIASQLPAGSLVIDGGDYGVWDDFRKLKNNPRKAPVVCNNKRGQWLCYLDLKLTRDSAGQVFSPPVCQIVKAKKVDPDPDVEKIAAVYFRQRREYFQALERARVHKRMLALQPNMYLGSEACIRCHQEMGGVWQKSRHASAFASLQRKQRDSDPDCLGCHVTGMRDEGKVGGFQSYTETPQMINVQCEACHGPGARHAQSPAKNRMQPHPEKQCLKCHDQDNDPGFSYEKKWPLIQH